MVGCANVGKTCIVRTYVEGQYPKISPNPSISQDIRMKRVILKDG